MRAKGRDHAWEKKTAAPEHQERAPALRPPGLCRAPCVLWSPTPLPRGDAQRCALSAPLSSEATGKEGGSDRAKLSEDLCTTDADRETIFQTLSPVDFSCKP